MFHKANTIINFRLPAANVSESELEASGDITILVHESFKKDLDSFHVSTSLKTSVSTSGLELHSKPRKPLPPSPPPPEHFTDNSGHKSLGKSQSDSSIVRSDDSGPHRKESKVKEAFFKFLHPADQDEQTKLSTDVTDQREQIKSSADDQQEQNTDMHMLNQKQQTQSSSIMTSQTESSMDIVDQQEQTRSYTDMVNQHEQTKSSADITDRQDIPDVVSQQESTKLSADLEQEEQTKSSSDITDLQEQEKSSTDMNDHQKQPKPSMLQRQMDMNNPYMKHTLKRQYKNKQNDSPVEASSKRQSWSSDMSNFSHMPGTIKEFSKVNYI